MTRGPNYSMQFLFEFCMAQYILVHGSTMAIPSFRALKYGHAFCNNFRFWYTFYATINKKRCTQYYIYHVSFAMTHGPNYSM